MKNRHMIGFQLHVLLLILGMNAALLVSASSSPRIWASIYNPCVIDPELKWCKQSSNSEQSQGSSQGVAPGTNTSNANQGTDEGLNPCITDPNKCKPPGDASDSSQGQSDSSQCGRSPYDPCPPVNTGQSQGSSQGTAPESSSGSSSNSNQEAINHINQAQSALQNGDTQGAQMHMDLAKKALGCNPGDPAHC